MTFRLDNNEARFDDFKEKLELTYIRVRDVTLPSGDVAYNGRGESGLLDVTIGHEIKHYPNDYLSSLSDKRLMNQLPRMIADYDMSYLCIVGEVFDINPETDKIHAFLRRKGERGKRVETPWGWHDVNSMLVKFERAGGKIRHFNDDDALVSFLFSSYKYWRKEEHETSVYVPARPKLNKAHQSWDLIEDTLADFYYQMGIGPKRALILSQYAPNVVELCLIPSHVIAQFPGPGKQKFGKGNAEKVWKFLHQTHGEKDENAVQIKVVK